MDAARKVTRTVTIEEEEVVGYELTLTPEEAASFMRVSALGQIHFQAIISRFPETRPYIDHIGGLTFKSAREQLKKAGVA